MFPSGKGNEQGELHCTLPKSGNANADTRMTRTGLRAVGEWWDYVTTDLHAWEMGLDAGVGAIIIFLIIT